MTSEVPGIGLGLEERLGCLGVVGAHGDLGNVDVAVGTGHRTEVLFRRLFAGRGELGHRPALGGLRCLATGVGVDLGVEHEDVDVPARGQDVVEPAEADVVGPAVATEDPNALSYEGAREREQVASRPGGVRVGVVAETPQSARRARLRGRAARTRPARLSGPPRVSRPPALAPILLGQAQEQPACPLLLGFESEADAEPELGVVLEQRVAPGRTAPVAVRRPRCRRQVAPVDRRATCGVGDEHAVAEELADELQVGRLTAARAGA